MLKFLKAHALLSLAFAAALLLTAVFLFKFVHSSMVWVDGAGNRDQPVAGWMTPRYVARTWDVPPEELASVLGLEMDGTGRRITLEELAARQGRDLDELLAELNDLTASARATADD